MKDARRVAGALLLRVLASSALGGIFLGTQLMLIRVYRLISSLSLDPSSPVPEWRISGWALWVPVAISVVLTLLLWSPVTHLFGALGSGLLFVSCYPILLVGALPLVTSLFNGNWSGFQELAWAEVGLLVGTLLVNAIEKMFSPDPIGR
jgi:hypothetical protein